METAKWNSDPRVAFGSPGGDDGRIEELIAEISRTIRAAEPGRRAELKELAEALLHDEVSSVVEMPTELESVPRRNSSNPLLAGLLLMLLGLGFFVIFPLLGLSVGSIGVVLATWGVFVAWFRK